METTEFSPVQEAQPAPRAHICTLTDRQRQEGYEVALQAALRARGFALAATSADPLPRKLEAAGKSHLCVLLLGPDLGLRDPLSSFSDTELEASAARDHPQTRLLVFAEQAADQALIPEQREFVDRMSHFKLGEFRASPVSTPGELLPQLERALADWRPAQPQPVPPALPVHADAVLISSTGKEEVMRGRRDLAAAALRDRNIPAIDYLSERSQDVPPVDLVTTWARECRLLLLILGQRYGYISPVDGLGATELEFVNAWGAGRPVLAFVGQDAEETSDPDQQQFAERVQALLPRENVVHFTSSEEFSQLLDQQLARFQAGLVPAAHGPAISAQQAHDWYRRQIQRWLGVIPHLTQPQGMPLDEKTFVSLQTLPQEEPGAADPRRVFSEDHGNQSHYSLLTIVPIEVDDALQQYPRLVLRGDPGSGKSITLRWYAINAPDGITPIFVRLAGYAAALQKGEVADLLDYVRQEERRLVLSSPQVPSVWLEALRAGTARLLLDALDEVPSHLQQQIASEIDDLAAQLNGATRIVVTTRIAGFPAKLGAQFVITQVQPLRRDQQRQLAEKWFLAAHRARPDAEALARVRTQQLMSWLDQEPQIAEWACEPLLMTFLAAVSDASQGQAELPATKAVLYRRVLRLMLTRWGGALNLRALGRHIWLKELVMLELARRNVLHGHGEVIAPEDLRQAISVLDREYHLDAGVPQADALLDELTEQDGIITRLASGLFAFQHATLQEYLAATLVAALPREERMELVTRRRLYARWEEVTQFCVSELDRLRRHDEADEVVRQLIRADAQPISPYSWRDPLRIALVRAARCQGGRDLEHVRTELSVHLLTAWWHIWAQGITDYHLSYVVPSAEEAFRALGRLGNPLIQRLAPLVCNQPDSSVYRFALRAVRAAGASAAPVAEELRQGLSSPDKTVRSAAALALGALGDAAEPALTDLCRTLDDPAITDDSTSVLRATVGPANIDEETGRMIKMGMLNRPPSLQNPPACAANALMQLGPVSARAQDALREILPTLNAYGRGLAIRVLGSLWGDATASLPVFMAALHDGDSGVRFNAVSALGCVGPAAAPAAGHLLSVMRETNTERGGPDGVHWAAIWAIRELGYGAVAILDDLREDLRSPSVETRRDVLFLLEQMGPVKLSLLADLRQALRDADTEVRWSAARAIGSLGPAAADACGDLSGALDDPETFVRVSACRALAALGRGALPAWDDLVRTTASDRGKVRDEAILALGALAGHDRGAEGITLLRQQMQGAGKDLRAIIVRAIAAAEQGDLSLRADLLEAIQDPDPAVRAQSMQALGRPSASVTAADARLRHLLSQPPDSQLAEVTATLGNGILLPLERLQQAIHDPDQEVRSQAIQGLGSLTPVALSLLANLRTEADEQRSAALQLAAGLEAVTAAILADLRQIARNPDDPHQVRAATSLRRCGASAALPSLEHLYPLLCDPHPDDERGGAHWARQSLGRNSPLGQAEENFFLPAYDRGIRDAVAATLAGTDDAGDGRDHSDVTQDRHRVPLTLALLIDRGDTGG